MKNAMSVDLEDWFCVSNLNDVIPRQEWDRCESRVVRNAHQLLELFERHHVKATFFVLGWIADRFPELVREIERKGHEISVHGYFHLQLTGINPEEFENDLKQSIEAVRRADVHQQVIGFRAPSFSVVNTTLWALPILERHQIKYDSSVFPVRFHPDYGIPEAPLHPYSITGTIREFPMSCGRLFGARVPCCGGAYFRFFPYRLTRYLVKKCNGEGRPVVFYVHPWEIDPGQPKVKLPLGRRARHYYGLNDTYKKLEKLLDDFEFTTLKEVLEL